MASSEHFRFFQHRECEYFPCHSGIPEEEFNCLFCFCPLYALGRKCGGRCAYTENGYKDCQNCTFPHWKDHYQAVLDRYKDIAEIVRQNDDK